MNEEKIQELLGFLSSIGFKGEQLEKNLQNSIQSGDREFKIGHEVLFGQEKVQFDLLFQLDQQFSAYRLTMFTATHMQDSGERGNARNFTPSAWGVCNANLAYHIVSGRMDDLLEKLSQLNLENFPGTDVYPKLEDFLSGDPEKFEIKCFRSEPEGLIEYTIPVSKIDGWYLVDIYKAILTPYPPIDHGTYNGVDTGALEDQMRRIDWHNDNELFVFHADSEPEFKPKVGDIQEQLYRLSLDMAGADIADKLQLKYWSDATFFVDSLQQSAWDYLDSLPKREQPFPVELESKAAFNLLCGRAILQNRVYPLPLDKPAWVRFDFTTKAPNGGYLAEVMPDFDRVQMESILNALPIPPDICPRIMRELIIGDITRFSLPDDKNIFLEANPEQQTVNVLSENMRPIQVNSLFDPDWKPKQHIAEKTIDQKESSRTNIRYPHHPDIGNPFRRRDKDK